MRGKLRTWTDAQFVAAVTANTNFTDVIRALGLRPAGGNHRTMRKHAVRLGLGTSHFTLERRLRGLNAVRNARRLTTADVFCAPSRVRSAALRRFAKRLIHPMRCARCRNTGVWRRKPLTLQLDHVNGVYDDNRLENLRWLCPNCHSQTATFAGKGKRRATNAPERP